MQEYIINRRTEFWFRVEGLGLWGLGFRAWGFRV